MTTTLLTLTLVVLLPGQSPAKVEPPRKPHPFAPSLPVLTDEQEAEFDKIVDNFILYDVGALKGDEGKKALDAFNRLGSESIFALIRGMNRAAALEESCPAVVIGKRIGSILRSTTDGQLLDFARENIGAGVKQSRHMGIIKDLRASCIFRKRAIDRIMASNPRMAPRTPYQTGDDRREMLVIKPSSTLGKKPPAESPAPSPGKMGQMSVAELAKAAEKNQGEKLKSILIEIERRSGDQVVGTLAQAAVSYEKETKQLAGDLLVNYLSRQDAKFLTKQLQDDRTPIRRAAATVVGKKGLRLGDELIDLLTDDQADVRQAAREALVKLGKGVDHGPARDASEADRDAAVKKWRAWWAKQAQ